MVAVKLNYPYKYERVRVSARYLRPRSASIGSVHGTGELCLLDFASDAVGQKQEHGNIERLATASTMYRLYLICDKIVS